MLHHKVLLQLTDMTSQDYVINNNDMWKYYSDFIDHPLPKHFVSAHGASHHAWTTGPYQCSL